MKGDLDRNLHSSPEDGKKKRIMSERMERRGDGRKEELNVLQTMHQLQGVGLGV